MQTLLLLAASSFDAFLSTDFPAADGFDFPVGDANGEGEYTDPSAGKTHSGWYVATRLGERYDLGIHTGEDWNGRGGADTDLGQPVFATARGKVVHAATHGAPWGGVIVIEHVLFENHQKRVVRSQYAHLSSVGVEAGAIVERRQKIGAIGRDPAGTFPAHLHFEIRSDASIAPTYWPSDHGKSEKWIRAHYEDPSTFIGARRKMFVPSDEPVLIIVDHASHRLEIRERGKVTFGSEIGFGQRSGRKRRQGDLKTPKGMYFVTEKSRGPFSGPYGAYYGGHWIKINYPNAYDAAYGLETSLIDSARADAIAARWAARELTHQGTPLGGGIGLHGWIDDWSWADTGYLSWGCVVFHNDDVAKAFEQIPIGAMVILF